MKRLITVVGFVLLMCAHASAAAPASAPARKTLQERMDSVIPEMRTDQISLEDTLDFLRDITGVNIMLDATALKAAGASKRTPVTLQLKGKTLRQALDAVTEKISKPDHTLVAGAVGEIVIISSKPALASATKQYAADSKKAGEGDPAQLNRTLPELRFDKIALTDVVDFLRDITGTGIDADWASLQKAGISKKTPISIKLRDLPLHQALRAVLTEAAAGSKGNLDFVVTPAKGVRITVAPPATG